MLPKVTRFDATSMVITDLDIMVLLEIAALKKKKTNSDTSIAVK